MRRFDTRALLAVMALLGAIGYQFTTFLVLHTTAEIPAWLSAVVMGVSGFYFGSRAAETTNGPVKAIQETGGTVTTTVEKPPAIPAIIE